MTSYRTLFLTTLGALYALHLAHAALPADAREARNANAIHLVVAVQSIYKEAKSPAQGTGGSLCIISGVQTSVLSRGQPSVPGFVSAPALLRRQAIEKLGPEQPLVVTANCDNALPSPGTWVLPAEALKASRLELWGDFYPVGDHVEFRAFDAKW